jgi:hypothetical protein
MRPKKGKVFPKKGKVFPEAGKAARSRVTYSVAIATALAGEFGGSLHATKTVMRWTGAGERTVKNWFAGSHGPNGMHLVALVQHSDLVFEAVLRSAGRELGTVSSRVFAIREALTNTLELEAHTKLSRSETLERESRALVLVPRADEPP